jgi:DNA-binding CsgD family transcriptional regulator
VDRLLEREVELEALVAAVERARSGRGTVALVRGEAGIGKTSLLRALKERARLPFHVGHCEPLSVPEPLGAMRELADGLGVPDMPELAAPDRRALARTLQIALASAGPAVVAVEDAHWADPATLDVVRILARRAEDAPLALVITLRDDELPANVELAVLVGDLATDPDVTRIALRPLSIDAVRSLTGGEVDAAEVARLTGGNPFLVVETVGAGGKLPVSVQDATLARVSRLGSEARGLVEVAAVVGHRVSPALLEELAPGQEGAVEEALGRGVLTDDGATLGFRHEMIRQAIEGVLSTPRRVALHGRVAEALGRQPDPDHARIAHHAEAAGLSNAAAEHAALAATAAEQVGALLEAGLQLDRALRLGRDLSGAVRIDLLIRYARSMNFAGQRLDDARGAAEEAVAMADMIGDRSAGGRARAVLSATLWSLDRLEDARRAAAEAVSVLEGTNAVAERARAYAALVRIESIAFDPSVAIAQGRLALAAAADAGLAEARIDTLVSLGLAHGHRGNPEAGQMLDDACREALEGGTAIQVIRAHVNAVAVAGDARDGARADRVVAEGLRRFADFETAIPREYLMVLHARTLLDRGHYDEAMARVAQGRGDWHGGLVIADAIEATIMARRGTGDCRARLEEALAQIEGLPSGWRHLYLHAALSEVAWIEGDLARARERARAGLAAAFATQLVRPAADALLWAARSGDSILLDADAPPLPEPVRLELAGDWRGAIAAWRGLDAPYEAALAALPGDERAARDAMATLKRLGALATSRAFAREREARGATSLRGPRRSTLASPAGLTVREQQVLGVLARGATNPEIAAALHLSERTVAHHVSAILSKLGVRTRTAAVQTAHAIGLLDGEDGQAAEAT